MRGSFLRAGAVTAAVALALFGCKSSATDEGDDQGDCTGAISSLSATPNSVTMDVGGSVGLIATAEDDCGEAITPSVSWSSNNTSVASIVQTSPSTATVHGESPGVAVVTAQADGESSVVSVTVNEEGGGVSLSLADYFPFGTGATWSYRIEGFQGTLVDEDEGGMVVDGQTWRRVCGTGLYGGSDPDEPTCNLWKVDQDQVLLRPMFGEEVSDEILLVLRAPISVGDSWTSQGATFTVVSVDPRQIGAFQFDDVVHLRLEVPASSPEDPDRVDLYIAPNVGLAEGDFYRDGVRIGMLFLTGFSQP